MELKNKHIFYAKTALMVGLPVVSVLMPELALAATYDVSDIESEFDAGEAPVATVASASIGLFVIRRVWKIIRSSI